MADVTQILAAAQAGDPIAAAQLIPLVYDELRKLAAIRRAAEKPGQTLQPTALVHEADVRLVGRGSAPTWDGRGHSFAAAAEAMRRILVENARRKQTRKRGGGLVRHPLDDVHPAAPEPDDELLALDKALDKALARLERHLICRQREPTMEGTGPCDCSAQSRVRCRPWRSPAWRPQHAPR